MGSCSVEDFTLAKSMRLLIKWIRPSNNEVPYSEFSIECTPSLKHKRDKVSTTGMDSPCMYWTWTSNRRHLSSSLCNLACASVMFFFNIVLVVVR